MSTDPDVALDALRAPLYRRDRAATAPDVVLGAILTLEAERDTDAADALRLAFAEHLVETGGEATLSAAETRLWAHVRSLASKELALPAPLRADMAGGLLTGIPDAGRAEALLFRTLHPAAATALAEALRVHAPELGAPILPSLEEGPPPRRMSARALLAAVGRGAVLLSGAVIALFVASQLRIPGRKPLPEAANARATVPGDDAPAAKDDSAALRRDRLADLARGVREALGRGRCDDAKIAGAKLRRAYLALPDGEREEARPSLSPLDDVSLACP